MGRVVLLVPAAVVLLVACGSGGGKATASSSSLTTTSVSRVAVAHLNIPAGKDPSKSAQMICEPEARADIASSLEVKETSVTKPTWHDHVYSCTYVYPQGKVGLSVKELVNAAATSTYFDAILQKYGVTERLPGFGQASWILRNDDVVVRKDYKVLFVDVQGLSKQFTPKESRADVAKGIAAVVMGCWTGA
jgi:hypothetical protein